MSRLLRDLAEPRDHRRLGIGRKRKLPAELDQFAGNRMVEDALRQNCLERLRRADLIDGIAGHQGDGDLDPGPGVRGEVVKARAFGV